MKRHLAARYLEAVADMNVLGLLPEVRVPTLVMHVRGDMRVPADLGRQMAAGIPGARFVMIPGRNHIPLEGEPAMARFLEEVHLFLAA
jgi:pimeloyl-ACP methyl ester carboxylesterase